MLYSPGPFDKPASGRGLGGTMPRPGLLLALLALSLCCCVTASTPFNLTVLHFNDWHNRMEPNSDTRHALCDGNSPSPSSCSGGFARMKHVIDQHRALDPSLLLLNAGDDFIGTPWDSHFTPSTGYDGKQPAFFLNQLKPDAMTIGNHDFDFGADALTKYLNNLGTPALGACNVQTNGHPLGSKLNRYIVINRNSVKICIFGLTTTETSPSKTTPAKILEPYSSGQQCAKELQQQSCQVIILLSHMGYTADLYAAQIIPGVDLIVGGHSHSLLWNGPAPKYQESGGEPLQDVVWGPYPTWVTSRAGKQVPVVQAGWGSRYMGIVQMTIDPQAKSQAVLSIKGAPMLLGCKGSDSPVDEDGYAVAEIKKWRNW